MPKHLTFLLLIPLLLWACGQSFERSELLGTYKNNQADEFIIVTNDGKYIHILKTENNTFKETGTWELEIFNGEPIIEFYNFDHDFEDTIDSRQKRSSVWPAFVERSFFGKIRLPTDPDFPNRYFEKLDNEIKKGN